MYTSLGARLAAAAPDTAVMSFSGVHSRLVPPDQRATQRPGHVATQAGGPERRWKAVRHGQRGGVLHPGGWEAPWKAGDMAE